VFIFDLEKSKRNRAKRGIDFMEAQALWNDPYMVEWQARSTEEPRRAVTGIAGGKLWTAIITKRGDAIRIISVRRARINEAEIYLSDRI